MLNANQPGPGKNAEKERGEQRERPRMSDMVVAAPRRTSVRVIRRVFFFSVAARALLALIVFSRARGQRLLIIFFRSRATHSVSCKLRSRRDATRQNSRSGLAFLCCRAGRDCADIESLSRFRLAGSFDTREIVTRGGSWGFEWIARVQNRAEEFGPS